MLEIGDLADNSSHSGDLLDRIAEALSITRAAFSEPSLCDQVGTAELLRLWLTIEHGQDRLKVLAIVRTIATDIAAQRRL